jgi:phosphatidylinositol phospholipase C, delta
VRDRDDQDPSTIPQVNPSVQISIFTPNQHNTPRKRTKIIKGNGFNPTWNEDFKIDFELNDGMLDFGFLHLEVFDTDQSGGEKTVGRWCVCLESLKSGKLDAKLISTGLKSLICRISTYSTL